MKYNDFVERGISAIISTNEILDPNTGTKEVNQENLNLIPDSKKCQEFVQLLYFYLGFSTTAIVRFFKDTRLQVNDIKLLLTTKQAEDNIFNKVRADNTKYNYSDFEPYFNELFNNLVDSKGNIVKTPEVTDSNFSDFVINLVNSSIESVNKPLEDNTSNSAYNLIFCDTLPEDVPEIDLPQVIKPVITQSTFSAKEGTAKPTTAEIVDRLVSDFGLCKVDEDYAIFDRSTKRWMFGIDWVLDIAIRYVWKHISTKEMKEIEKRVALPSTLETREALPIRFIGFNNCVVDYMNLTNGKPTVYKYSPSWIMRDIIPHDYNPDADPTFVKSVVLDKICDGELDKFTCLAEEFGFAMYPSYSGYVDIIHSLNKKGNASNGKSCWTDSLIYLWGGSSQKQVTSFEPSELGGTENKFNASELERSRVNVGGDISKDFSSSKCVGILKNIVLGGSIQAEAKYQKSRSIVTNAQFVFAANKLPGFDTDEGLERRLRFISFNHIFSPKDPDYVRNMSERLWKNENNMQAMINLGLEALRNFKERGDIATFCTWHEQMLNNFISDNCVVAQWMDARGYTKAFLTSRAPIKWRDDIAYTPKEKEMLQERVFGAEHYNLNKTKDAVMTIDLLFADFDVFRECNKFKFRNIKTFKKELEDFVHVEADTSRSDVNGTKEQKARLGYKGTVHQQSKFFRQPMGEGKREFALEHEDAKLNLEELKELYLWITPATLNEVISDIQDAGLVIPDEILEHAKPANTSVYTKNKQALAEEIKQQIKALQNQLNSLEKDIENEAVEELREDIKSMNL